MLIKRVLQEARDNFSVLNLNPPKGRENAHTTATSRNIANSDINVRVGGGQDSRLGLSPIGFLEQREAFDPPHTYMRKLIMMIGKGSQASNIPCL